MPTIGVIGYAAGATFFLILSLVLFTGHAGQARKHVLRLAAAASAVWMGVTSYQLATQQVPYASFMLELLRDFAWLAFVSHILTSVYGDPATAQARFRRLLGISAAFILMLAMMMTDRFLSGTPLINRFGLDWLIAGHLVVAIAGLVLVEQLFRNTRSESRRAIKYICMGVGALFAFDFYLYSDALLFQRINGAVWQARGYVNAITVPVLAIAVARDPKWSLDIFVSRHIVFHTASLLGTGIYLLAMGAGGYYVRAYGGTWGGVAQVIFLFGAGLVLAMLLFSDQLRASLRVHISKHFFHYKYDYRDEWLRFIGTLSSGEPDVKLRERVVHALAQIIKSPGGILWMRRESGRFEPLAHWGMDEEVPEVAHDSQLVSFLQEQEWVINMDEYERDRSLYEGLELPSWLSNSPGAWLVVPLMMHDHLLGFVVLARSPMQASFNWEDCDLLKTAGRQAASHLAQLEASRALSDARQFEMCNRLSTYVMHDLKNLIAQLSLVVSNAAKHKHNPQFMEDAIKTVENSVDKMNRLMVHLRTGGAADTKAESIELCELVHDVAETMGNGLPAPAVDCQAKGIYACTNRERFAAVIGHIVRNAQDATPDNGSITMRLFQREETAIIEVQDNGSGMDEVFIRDRLFRPFDTTKGTSGMGIGVYETREFVRAMGGDVEVISRVGEGTTFRLQFPISDQSQNNVQFKLVETGGCADDGKLKEIARC